MNEWEAPRDERPPMSYYDGLYHEHATGRLRLCYYYLGSREQAEDVVQDVFVRLISSGISIKPGSEKAYLLRAVVNHCKDVWLPRSDPAVLLPELHHRADRSGA